MIKENIKDNWLKEEMAREEKISIWDLYDNRKDVFDEHHNNCERQELERKHAYRHANQRFRNQVANTTPDAQKMKIVMESIIAFIITTPSLNNFFGGDEGV